MIFSLLQTQVDAPQQLQAALRQRLAHVRLGSATFRKTLDAVLARFGADIDWEPSYGPTPIRIGVVSTKKPSAPVEMELSIVLWRSKNGVGAQVLDGGPCRRMASPTGSSWIATARTTDQGIV